MMFEHEYSEPSGMALDVRNMNDKKNMNDRSQVSWRSVMTWSRGQPRD